MNLHHHRYLAPPLHAAADRSCAQALVAKYGGELDQGLLQGLLEELALLVSDSDLLLTAMALSTCTTLLLQQPGCAGAVSSAVMPPALRLVQSQLLQVCCRPLGAQEDQV